ncbi:MAG TPA: class I SAM-dependent methyltransferase [Solirubrobacteraceae bacterium]|jgi:SAM-dependent methyltransferase|nr:class I SAM-dependent methyltransferase [Solirubrobacteraceae bacterium]
MNGVRTDATRVGSHAPLADEYWGSGDRVARYLTQIDALPHLKEGEEVLLDHLPHGRRHVLDLGAGDGRLIGMVRAARPEAVCVGIDYSEAMLAAARERFANDVLFVGHDLATPLPDLGKFDAIISSFATHNLTPASQRLLYESVFERLVPGGVFCNLDHVGSPTRRLHDAFYRRIAQMTEFDHRSHTTLAVSEHLQWLRELEFDDVDCYWKWLELALIVGVRAG